MFVDVPARLHRVLHAIAGIAETNRAPFDFPEAEQELVAGYHTEYSRMAFAMFFLAEYINMITVSAVATNLFLGGWHGPFIPAGLRLDLVPDQAGVLLFGYLWLRWTLPRFRYDQLMAFGWKVLLPVATVNLLVTRGGGALLWALISCSSTRSPAVAVLGSLLVIGQRNPIYSVLALIVAFFGLSGLYVLLEAPFVAVVQIIIYAGAIMVLFLFVVMLLNVPREDAAEWDRAHPLIGRGRCASARCWRCCWSAQLAWALSRTPGMTDGDRRRSGRRVSIVGRARARALHRLHVRVRGDVDPDPRGDGRRRHPGAEAGRTDADVRLATT